MFNDWQHYIFSKSLRHNPSTFLISWIIWKNIRLIIQNIQNLPQEQSRHPYSSQNCIRSRSAFPCYFLHKSWRNTSRRSDTERHSLQIPSLRLWEAAEATLIEAACCHRVRTAITSQLQFHLLFLPGDFSSAVVRGRVAVVVVDRQTVFGGGSSSGNTTTPESIFKNAIQAMGYSETRDR